MQDLMKEYREDGEFATMEKLLPYLTRKGHISEIECRIIAGSGRRAEMQSKIKNILMSRKRKSLSMTDILDVFEEMTLWNYHPVENTNNGHPLLNSVISKHLFEFLPLRDIMNCRVVCREWTSTAEPLFRKKATIRFKSLRYSTFLNIYRISLPTVPFTAFEFTSKPFWMSDIEEFFTKWGKNVKGLKLNNVVVMKKEVRTNYMLYPLDITPWLAKLPNLAALNIDCSEREHYGGLGTFVQVPLEKLFQIKDLNLSGCLISTSSQEESTVRRICPSKITLTDNIFQRGQDILNEFCLNDLINFGGASTITVHGDNGKMFNMADQEFNSKSLSLVNLELENWENARGIVDFVYLQGSTFCFKNQLQIRQLYCNFCEIDFQALPQTLEKLHLSAALCVDPAVQLPNLKSLCIELLCDDFNQTAAFVDCPELTELELIKHAARGNDSTYFNLDVLWIPKNLNKMKIGCKINVINDDFLFQLDVLILEDYLHLLKSDIREIISKIRPKVLVVSCRDSSRLNTNHINDFVFSNHLVKKIIIGSAGDEDLHIRTPYETGELQTCVNQKANYYLFENLFGKAITKEEFDNWRNLD